MAKQKNDPTLEIIEQLIQARKKAKLSQAELAKRLQSQQPAIARLENGGYINTSIISLGRIAEALGYALHICLSNKNDKDMCFFQNNAKLKNN